MEVGFADEIAHRRVAGRGMDGIDGIGRGGGEGGRTLGFIGTTGLFGGGGRIMPGR